MAKSLKMEERNRDVIRLKATGLYSNKQIAQALGIGQGPQGTPHINGKYIGASTVSSIYTERPRVPNDPIMSYEEVALMEDVNTEVVKCLILGSHLKTIEASAGFGRDIHGRLIISGVKMSDARGIGTEWVSVEEAAKVAGMQRPRGMYNRALKRQVVSTRAHVGEAFHLGNQKGLKIIVRKDSVEPAQRKSRHDPSQQELPLEAKRPEFAVIVWSDTSEKPVTILGKQVDISITYEHSTAGVVRELLKIDIDMLPGDRPQVRTSYTQ